MFERLRPLLTLAKITLRGSLTGYRGPGLAIGAFLPVVVVAGLILYGITGFELVNAYELLVEGLFLPFVLLLVCLLLAVPLFREEIDRESLSYLLTRTIPKLEIILGKYLGYLGAALVVLIPPVVVGYGLVAVAGSPPSGLLTGVLPALLASTTLGIVAFGAFYLFLGLVVREALIVGLIYAFVWEFLIGDLTGIAPDLSIMHYLMSLSSHLISQGPLSTYPTQLTLAQSVAGPLVFAAGILVLTYLAFREYGYLPAGK